MVDLLPVTGKALLVIEDGQSLQFSCVLRANGVSLAVGRSHILNENLSAKQQAFEKLNDSFMSLYCGLQPL